MSNHTAVIGQPVEHSISPKIHNFWIKENRIEVGEYKKILLNKEDIKSFLEKAELCVLIASTIPGAAGVLKLKSKNVE